MHLLRPQLATDSRAMFYSARHSVTVALVEPWTSPMAENNASSMTSGVCGAAAGQPTDANDHQVSDTKITCFAIWQSIPRLTARQQHKLSPGFDVFLAQAHRI
jgi:hypothetical protein